MEVGETETEPPATGVTAPTPWSMEADVEFVVVHVSVEEEPETIEVGEATRVQDGAFGTSVIVTVATQVTVPPAPVAVKVYVVVELGETEAEPPATGVTAPMP